MQSNQIKNSLRAMQKVFEGIEAYRVLGSTLVASINGKPHRVLHDIDLLIDKRVYPEVVKRFADLGFKRVTKRAPGFSWDEFEKADHLTFGVLLRGEFKQDYFEYKSGRWMTLRILSAYLTPTEYKLYGVAFRGIPLRSVYEGIKAASLNTKRKKDKAIVAQAVGDNLPNGPTINQAFGVKLFGITIPFLYTLFSEVYNLIGGIRLRLGKSYDAWH